MIGDLRFMISDSSLKLLQKTADHLATEIVRRKTKYHYIFISLNVRFVYLKPGSFLKKFRV